MTLSVFPSLLAFEQISPLLIRLTLGVVLVYSAYRALSGTSLNIQKKSLHIIEALAGLFLILGLWTQVAALFATVDLIVRLIDKIIKKAFLTDGVNYYLILLVLAISLLFTGGGFLGFDRPL